MKRFALLLLAFTMLFVMAGAEESFVEEDFAAAASFDDEFFAEETFFGDEFEAEQPAEDEVEDRSVFLFEHEQVPVAREPWQYWDIVLTTNDGLNTTSKNKVTLKWSITKGTPEHTTAQPDRSGQELTAQEKGSTYKANKKALSGIKYFVYMVDPVTGEAKQLKTTTKEKMTVTVKNPGTYKFYVSLERVKKKTGVEDLGKASNQLPVTFNFDGTKISKVKAYANVYNSLQPTIQPENMYIEVFTKEADKQYTVTLAQKKVVEPVSGVYKISDEDREWANDFITINGFLPISLSEIEWSTQPEFKVGKKINVTVQGSGKAKKTSVTPKAPKAPKAPTLKTSPIIITEAWQIDSKTVRVKWFDQAVDRNLAQKPEFYKIQVGKTPVTVKLDDPKLDTYSEQPNYYGYTVTGIKEAKKKQTLKINVKSSDKKVKKAKTYKLAFYPPTKLGAILNPSVYYDTDEKKYFVEWASLFNDNEVKYEVYATDNKHTKELVKDGIKGVDEDSSAQPYSTVFEPKEFNQMEGSRVSFVIKAVKGHEVIARSGDNLWTWIHGEYEDSVIEPDPGATTVFKVGDEIDPEKLFKITGEFEEIHFTVFNPVTYEIYDIEDLIAGKLSAGEYAVAALLVIDKEADIVASAAVTITLEEKEPVEEPSSQVQISV